MSNLSVRSNPVNATSGSFKYGYYDKESRTLYYPPATLTQLSAFAGYFQKKGGYVTISIGLKKKLKNLDRLGQPEQLCDVIVLKKSPYQVEYENPPSFPDSHRSNGILGIFYNFSNLISGCKFYLHASLADKNWKETQGAIFREVTEDLNRKIKNKEWLYETFMVAGGPELLELGYSQEAAKKIHLVALFYKKAIKFTLAVSLSSPARLSNSNVSGIMTPRTIDRRVFAACCLQGKVMSKNQKNEQQFAATKKLVLRPVIAQSKKMVDQKNDINCRLICPYSISQSDQKKALKEQKKGKQC